MSTHTQDRPSTPQAGSSADDRAFLGHPKGLSTLFFVELWERFSYYGMRAILLYFLIDTAANGGLGIDETTGTAVVAIYGASVYLLSIIGGFTADRLFGARRSTLYGAVVIMAGHVCLAIPASATAWLGIALVALGTGLLKPNVSSMVGTLYRPEDARRDGGFSIFYMSINIGSFFSPLVVGWLRATTATTPASRRRRSAWPSRSCGSSSGARPWARPSTTSPTPSRRTSAAGSRPWRSVRSSRSPPSSSSPACGATRSSTRSSTPSRSWPS